MTPFESYSINALNGQGMSLQFKKFAQLSASAAKGGGMFASGGFMQV